MKSTSRKIYTRQGDKGETRILSGEKVFKDEPRVKAYGALDELQSHLGFARVLAKQESVKPILYAIQEDIFTASAELASTPEGLHRLKRRINRENTKRLEYWIDEITAQYGLPRHFVVPGWSPDGAALHVARAVCRRCERIIVTLNRSLGVYDELIVYFNRLGDLLFMVSWSLELVAVVENVVQNLISDKS